MIPIGEVRVTKGYYEVVSCSELAEIEEERLRERLKEYCRVRGSKDIEILKFFILRDKEGNVYRVWSLEVYYGPFGAMIYLDNPWL